MSRNRNQSSIEAFAVAGLQMQPRARVSSNGVVAVNEEDWSNNGSTFDRIWRKFKLEFKNKNITKDITKYNFSKAWNGRFSWLYVQFGYITAAGAEIFEPREICMICNRYYSHHSTVKFRGDGKLIKGVGLLGSKPPQIKGLKIHDLCNNHMVALGLAMTPSDLTVFSWVHFSAKLGVSMQTHPVFMYLIKHFFNGDPGNKLHSINSGKKMTVVCGSIVKAAVIHAAQQATWIWWGEDGVDDSTFDLFYIWFRIVVCGEPIQLFFGVRAEVRKKAATLFEIFSDLISGADIEYGYDLRKKIESQIVNDYNDEVKQGDFDEKELLEYKPPVFTKVLQDINTVKPKSLTLGLTHALSKTIGNTCDGAPNQYSDLGGFNGLLMTAQEEVLHLATSIIQRNHCGNHVWDLNAVIIAESSLNLRVLSDIIERARKLMEILDVKEIYNRMCIIYRTRMVKINSEYAKRWCSHLNKALGQFNIVIDVIIATLIEIINTVIDKNNQKDMENRTKWIQLLSDICANYLKFFVVKPVIHKASELNTNMQSWTLTCIELANQLDVLKLWCENRTGTERPQSVISRIQNVGIIKDALLKKNVKDLKQLNKDLLERELIEENIQFKWRVTQSALKIGKTLADEYAKGIENFESYKRWDSYRFLVCQNEWNQNDEIGDIDDAKCIEEWLENNKSQREESVHSFKLKIDMDDFNIQYDRYVNQMLKEYGDGIKNYNWLDDIKKKLKNKRWCRNNESLADVFRGILTEATSNGMAESLGHIGKTPDDAKSRGIILRDCALHLKLNGPAFDKSQGFVRHVIDFWYKCGYCGTDTLKLLNCKSMDVCDKEVERYNAAEGDTNYKRRLQSKKKRQDTLCIVNNSFMVSCDQ